MNKNSHLINSSDITQFREGSHNHLYDKLGAHQIGSAECSFAVWAPNALFVSVIGDFNEWDSDRHPMILRDDESGIWEIKIQNVSKGQKYKFHIVSPNGDYSIDKSDPYAIFCEQPPGNASIVWNLDHNWQDNNWLKNRERLNNSDSPISIYEIHLPSWRRVTEDKNRPLTYLELAELLPKYVKEMGFTHVEFLPVMEHPLYGSWGYQIVGYFAPSSRYGTPQEFMQLVEALHNKGIGMIYDWVPSHFPTDAYGLAHFDGTHLYESEDPKKNFHPDWHTFIFDYTRPQVRNFLTSNAFFWLDIYHGDAIRFDAVASMLYLDYSRKDNWEPNVYGGRENLEAIDFLRKLNSDIYLKFPYAQTIAEESTDWSMVSRPTYVGGLGFGMKWNMGWMHDILEYMNLDPIYRKYHHHTLQFNIHYAFSENFILPLSHDEVVHEKRSLLSKMPGDTWQKMANLRLLYGYMFGHPGKKLLFMGAEFGQWAEWNHQSSLDWHLVDHLSHRQIQYWVRDLNLLYQNQPALYELDFDPLGFEWIDMHNWEESIIAFMRKGKNPDEDILIVCNFTPVPRYNYRIGVDKKGNWKEILNSDSKYYGGSNVGNQGGVETKNIPSHGKPYSLNLTLPPLSTLFFINHENINK